MSIDKLHKLIERYEKRVKQLTIELVMKNYYDGWTLNGMKKEIESLKSEINEIKKDLEK